MPSPICVGVVGVGRAGGKHVLVEKPMTTSYAAAYELVEQARASRGRLFVMHNRRFEPAFQHIRELYGEHGRTAEVIISGGVALNEPEVSIWGKRGALQADHESIRLRYLDPARPLESRQAHAGTPGEEEDTRAPDEALAVMCVVDTARRGSAFTVVG